MSTIYNQGKDGTCTAFSVLNILESQFKTTISQRFADTEINRWFCENGFSKEDGLMGITMLQVMKVKPLIPGFFVSSCKKIWSKKKRPAKDDLTKIYEAVVEGGVIFGLEVRKGKPTLKLDEEHNLVPYKTDIRGGHAVAVAGFELKNSRYLIENSWSNKWGKEGYFYLKESDVLSEVSAVYQVVFKKV